LIRIVAALLGLSPVIAVAQPGIGQNGVVNAASQIAPTLSGGAIARGALFDISGVRLVAAGPTEVTISQQGVTIPLTIVSAQPRKIEALMPRNAPLGNASLVVTVAGRASRPFPVEIVASNPGIFSRNLEGWGAGRIENLGPNSARSSNSFDNPAHPGEQVRIATTGFGSATRASLYVGSKMIQATPARGARDGEEQLTVTIPADAPKGCWVPMYLLAAPNRASNVVTISISPAGAACDSGPVPLWSNKNVMVVALSRSYQKPDRPDAPEILSDDAVVLIQSNHRANELSRADLLPPSGTCTSATSSYQSESDLTLSLSSLVVPQGGGLDAGDQLTLERSGETRTIGENAAGKGDYRARLGLAGMDLNRKLPPPFLLPGEFKLTAPGGPNIGPFSLNLLTPPEFQWTDRDQINSVDRKLGVTLHWTGGDRDQKMLIALRNVDLITTAIGMCLCVAPAQAHQFTIPAALLANIPASIRAPGAHYDKLAIGMLGVAPLKNLSAKGLDAGFLFVIYDYSRYVDFR